MPRLRTLTIDGRTPPGGVDISRESLWSAAIAAGHVTQALSKLQSPLTGPRAYLIADMSDSEALIRSKLSDMTLSSKPLSPPYLTQIVEGIRRISNDDLAELEARLEGAASDNFRLEFPVKKSRSIREARLVWAISLTDGPGFVLSIEHSTGKSLYSLPYDSTEYALAKGVAQGIFVEDSAPLFEDYYRDGYFKAAPSFDVAGDYFEIPDSFFMSGGSRPR